MITRLSSGALGGAVAVALLAACAVEAAPVSSASAASSVIAAQAPIPAQAPIQASVQAQVQPVTYDASVWCDIRITRTRDGLRFTPVAEANAYHDVSYRFTLTRIDANGSSDVEQGGDVSLAPYERVTLSSNELSIDRGGRYRARLVIEDDYGVVCRQEARS